MPLLTQNLGRLAYAPALALQRETHLRVAQGYSPAVLYLVEHDPVITVSQRKLASDNLVANPETLARLGIDVQPTDRGGNVTYHGPGQLVAYPILRLNDHGLNLGRYMRLLEEVVIETLARFDVIGHREAGAAGVWVDLPRDLSLSSDQDDQADQTGQPMRAKICAVGVRIAKNTTLHGLALNVTTNLDHFNTIIPCGLIGRPVTSLRQLLGDRCPSMPEVRDALIQAFDRALPAAGRS